MTANEFRRLGLSLPETEEHQHRGHPDFRLRGKIFATLAHPNKGYAMVKLAPAEQARFFEAESEIFIPIKGVWGRRGATHVLLKPANRADVRRALPATAAWRNTAPKDLIRNFDEDS
jgi:hypothetical protein